MVRASGRLYSKTCVDLRARCLAARVDPVARPTSRVGKRGGCVVEVVERVEAVLRAREAAAGALEQQVRRI